MKFQFLWTTTYLIKNKTRQMSLNFRSIFGLACLIFHGYCYLVSKILRFFMNFFSRQGPAAMVVSGIMGGFLLGLIEGMGVLMNHMASTAYRPVDPQNPPQDPNVFGGMEIKN